MHKPDEILRRVRKLELKTRHLVKSAFAGHYHSAFKGSGMNFDEVREYEPGDEIRSIDWNVTARMDKPYVKKFAEERELIVMLLVDVSASESFGSLYQSKREFGTEIASVLAFSAIQNNDRVGLILFSDRLELFIPPKKRHLHVLRLIREMLVFEPHGKRTEFSAAFKTLNHVIHQRAMVFILSDFLIQDLSTQFIIASRKHDLVAFSILDPGEISLPDVGVVTFEDAETGQQIALDTSNKGVVRELEEIERKQRRTQQKLLQSVGVDCTIFPINAGVVAPLRAFFEKRRKRLL